MGTKNGKHNAKTDVKKSFLGGWNKPNKKPPHLCIVAVFCPLWCLEGYEMAVYENGEYTSMDGRQITSFVKLWYKIPKPPKNVF